MPTDKEKIKIGLVILSKYNLHPSLNYDPGYFVGEKEFELSKLTNELGVYQMIGISQKNLTGEVYILEIIIKI